VAVLIYPKAAHETINEDKTIENKENTIYGTREWHDNRENNKHTEDSIMKETRVNIWGKA
jgi:hypothetical protein